VIASAEQIAGIGFTSQRTRTRMVRRLIDRGIENENLLHVLGTVPRHLFVDEAISLRLAQVRDIKLLCYRSWSMLYLQLSESEICWTKQNSALERFNTEISIRVTAMGVGGGQATVPSMPSWSPLLLREFQNLC